MENKITITIEGATGTGKDTIRRIITKRFDQLLNQPSAKFIAEIHETIVLRNSEIRFFESTPGETLTGDGTGQALPEIQKSGVDVLHYPLTPAQSLPTVSWEPKYGFKITHGSAIGTGDKGLSQAVENYNVEVKKRVILRRMENVTLNKSDVEELPGYQDAIAARAGHIVETKTAKAKEAAEAEEKAKIDKALEAFESSHRRANGSPLSALAAMGALLGMFGIEGFDDNEEKERPPIQPSPIPELLELLERSGLSTGQRQIVPGVLSGVSIAIPKKFGRAWGEDVQDAIGNSNPAALRVLLTTAGLI